MALPTTHPLHETIRALRQERGLTQQQVGTALGMTKANIHRMEKGLVKVSATKLQQLAALFGVSVDEIRTYLPPSVHTAWAAEREFLSALVDSLRWQVNQAHAILAGTEPVLATFQQAVQVLANSPAGLTADLLQEWWAANQRQATTGFQPMNALLAQPNGEPLPLSNAVSTLRALLALWHTNTEATR